LHKGSAMAVENAITIVVGILSIIIPFYIFLKGKNREASIIYGVIGFLAGPIWAVALAFFRESTDLVHALFWDKLIYIDATFIAPLFFLFASKFPRKRAVHILVWTVIIAFGGLFLFQILETDQFIHKIILNDTGNTIEIGWGYYLCGSLPSWDLASLLCSENTPN